jgi:DNA-binding PadR family transcriptional regulator
VEARQGARRRYYEITALGQKALRQTKAVMTRVLRPVRISQATEVLA